MNFIVEPFFYMVAIPAILLTGISKGGFAGSFGMLTVPLFSLAIPPVQAAAIILPILCLMDIFGVVAYRRKVDWQNLSYVLPGAIVGIAVGTLLFKYLNDDIIRLILGSISVAFTLNYLFRPKPEGHKAQPSRIKGGFWGSISGFTSFVAHSGGPPLQFYMLPQKLDKTLFIGTSVWFFLIVNYTKLIPYAFLGQFSSENLGTSLVLLPLAPVGIWFGFQGHKYVPEKIFYKFAYIMLFFAGLKLLVDGLNGIYHFF